MFVEGRRRVVRQEVGEGWGGGRRNEMHLLSKLPVPGTMMLGTVTEGKKG